MTGTPYIAIFKFRNVKTNFDRVLYALSFNMKQSKIVENFKWVPGQKLSFLEPPVHQWCMATMLMLIEREAVKLERSLRSIFRKLQQSLRIKHSEIF